MKISIDAHLIGLWSISLLFLPPRVHAQQVVEGTTLGVTRVSDLIEVRGTPVHAGNNVDGCHYVSFGGERPIYTYYFSPEDSIVEWARVFVVSGYTPTRVREAFGRPDSTTFGADLSKHELFSARHVSVEYAPSGDVNYIEYHPDSDQSIGDRRAQRATAVIDSVMAETLVQDHPGLSQVMGIDSVRMYRYASIAVVVRNFTPAVRRKPLPQTTVTAATRYQSLCARIDCDAILKAHRAYDSQP